MRQSNGQSGTANKRIAGMSLVEITVAMAIIVIALLPLMLMMNYAIKNMVFSSKSSVASKVAQELMEEILARPKWDEQQAVPGRAITPPPPPGSTAPGNLGLDGPEAYPNFNDIDDYNKATLPNVTIGNSVFQRSVVVEYVKIDDTTGVITTGGIQNFKRVTVSVTWKGNNKSPVTISTIVANVNKY